MWNFQIANIFNVTSLIFKICPFLCCRVALAEIKSQSTSAPEFPRTPDNPAGPFLLIIPGHTPWKDGSPSGRSCGGVAQVPDNDAVRPRVTLRQRGSPPPRSARPVRQSGPPQRRPPRRRPARDLLSGEDSVRLINYGSGGGSTCGVVKQREWQSPDETSFRNFFGKSILDKNDSVSKQPLQLFFTWYPNTNAHVIPF